MKIISKTQMTQRGPKLSQSLSPQSLKSFPQLIKIALVSEAVNQFKAF